MPRFAHFDPSHPQPRRVLAWFDTDRLKYENLPSAECLLEITDDEWKARLSDPSAWVIRDGKLTFCEPAEKSEK